MTNEENDLKNPGIWPMYEIFYFHSMHFSTNSALQSANTISKIITKLENESAFKLNAAVQTSILDNLQNIINQAGILSKYFWPSDNNKLYKNRAEQLKSKFQMGQTSALKDRTVRNYLEHFDEKLDHYLSEGIVGHIIPAYVGFSYNESEVPLHVFRAYYIKSGIFKILDREFLIQPIVDEILRIHDILATRI